MNKRLIVKSFAIIFMCVVFVTNIFAADVQKYEEELQNIKDQLKENSNKLSGVEKELNQDLYEMAELDLKMVQYSKELATVQEKVDNVNAKLQELEDSLQNSAQIYNNAEDMYNTRLRAIYENGIPSIVDILLSSKGIRDFFSRMNVYNSVLEYDKSLVTNMQNQKEYLDYIKKDIEVQKLQLEQLKYDKEKSTQALEDTMNAKNKKISNLQSTKTDLQQKSKILEQQRDAANKRVEEELRKAYEEALNKGNDFTFTGSEFAWPVPGFNVITTRFNTTYDPFNSGKNYMHYGTDIAGSGISGKPILAVQSGKVEVPPFSQSGYGNYVIITHGKSVSDGNIYTSLYGHMSAIAVTTGQFVTKGQVIGYVGSTGWSTGAHLHLEMRRNNTRFDPLSVFPGISFVYR